MKRLPLCLSWFRGPDQTLSRHLYGDLYWFHPQTRLHTAPTAPYWQYLCRQAPPSQPRTLWRAAARGTSIASEIQMTPDESQLPVIIYI